MALTVGLIVLLVGSTAWITRERWHGFWRSASGLDPTPGERTYESSSTVRLLRSDEDLSQALQRAKASTDRIAADVASRRYARFAVVPRRDDAA